MTLVTWLVRILLGLVLVVLLAIGGVLLLQPQLDLSPHRAQLSSWLTGLAGREVRLDGEIQLALGRQSRLSVGDVRITNPPWATSPALLRAGHASIALDLGALLSGAVQVDDVQLRDATAVLEVSADGDRGWAIGRRQGPAPGDGRPGGLWRTLTVEQASIENLSVIYRAAPSSKPFDLHIAQLRQRNDAGMLDLHVTGRVEQSPLEIDGRAGPLGALLARRGIDVDLRSTLGDTLLTLTGRLGDPLRLEDIEIQSTLRSPDLAELLAVFGIDYQKDSDIDLTLTVTDLDRGFAWQALGRFGPVDLDTQGELARPLALQDGRLRFDLSGDDLAAVGQLLGIQPLPLQPYRLAGQVQRSGAGLVLQEVLLETGETRATLLGEMPLFPDIDQASSQIAFSMPRPVNYAGLLGALSGSLGPIHVEASLDPRPDGTEMLEARVELGDDRLTLTGPFGGLPGYRGTRLAFELTGPDIAVLAAKFGTEGVASRPYRVAGEIAVGDDDHLRLALDDGRLGDLGIAADGSLGRLPELVDADLTASATGRSLRRAIGAVAGTELPDLPFDVTVSVTGDLRRPTIGDLQARLGDARLTSVGTVGLPPKFAGTDGTIELTIPDIAPLLGPLPAEMPRLSGGYRGSARLRTEDGMLVISGARIDGDDLRLVLDGSLPMTGELAGTRLRWQARGKNLAAVLPATDVYRPPSLAFDSAVDMAVRREHLEIRDYRVKIGDAEVRGKASLALRRGATDSHGQLRLSGPRLADLGEFRGIDLPDRPFELKGALRQTAAGYAARDVSFRLGDGSGTVSLDYAPGQPPRVELDATLRDFDLHLLLATEPAAQAADAGSVAGGRLIPDTRPRLDALDALNGEFRVRAEGLAYADPVFDSQVLLRDLDLHARLEGGDLAIERLLASGDRGNFDFHGRLDRGGPDIEIALRLQAVDARPGFISTTAMLKDLPPHEIEIELTAAGSTYRQLAGSANGRLEITGGEGLVDNAALEAVLNDFFDELLKDVNPFVDRERRTRVVCTAAVAEIRDGVLRLDPGAVARTDKIDIAIGGRIDLNDETVDVRFRNTPRRGLGISLAGFVKPFVRVGGTLAAPGITLDAPSALLSGTAAVATGGLSILATKLLERAGSVLENPCERVIDSAAAGRGQAGGDTGSAD